MTYCRQKANSEVYSGVESDRSPKRKREQQDIDGLLHVTVGAFTKGESRRHRRRPLRTILIEKQQLNNHRSVLAFYADQLRHYTVSNIRKVDTRLHYGEILLVAKASRICTTI